MMHPIILEKNLIIACLSNMSSCLVKENNLKSAWVLFVQIWDTIPFNDETVTRLIIIDEHIGVIYTGEPIIPVGAIMALGPSGDGIDQFLGIHISTWSPMAIYPFALTVI